MIIACIAMAYMVKTCIAVACIVMACIVMACIVMAYSHGLCSYGPT